MTGPRSRIAVRTPAKLNLGLEIVDRRSDGYHDIVTIMQAVSRFDHLQLLPDTSIRLTSVDPTLVGQHNLVVRALELLRDRGTITDGAHAILEKTIPVAGGLGGASSDAAAALLSGQRLWATTFDDDELAEFALSLGADVPFFMRGGTALATERGENLEPLPPLEPTHFVVVAPTLFIPRKTASLYAALVRSDFTTGDHVRAFAESIREHRTLRAEFPGNAFVRPLYALHPELRDIRSVMLRVGAPFVALSGAGPSHYTAVDDGEEAERLVGRLAAAFSKRAAVFGCHPMANGPSFEIVE